MGRISNDKADTDALIQRKSTNDARLVTLELAVRRNQSFQQPSFPALGRPKWMDTMANSTRPDATAKVIDIDIYQKNLNSSCLDIRLRKMWPGGTMFKPTKFHAAILAAAIMLTGTLSPSYAETGAVRFHIVKAGFIVGAGGGSGTLNFKGKQYRLSIGGINVGTIGASSVDLTGTASNLRTAADIVGSYTQTSAALAVVGGGRTATLRNAKGVVIQVRGPAVGLEASLSLSGMTISMQ